MPHNAWQCDNDIFFERRDAWQQHNILFTIHRPIKFVVGHHITLNLNKKHQIKLWKDLIACDSIFTWKFCNAISNVQIYNKCCYLQALCKLSTTTFYYYWWIIIILLKALTKFLKCVDWSQPQEARQVDSLVSKFLICHACQHVLVLLVVHETSKVIISHHTVVSLHRERSISP